MGWISKTLQGKVYIRHSNLSTVLCSLCAIASLILFFDSAFPLLFLAVHPTPLTAPHTWLAKFTFTHSIKAVPSHHWWRSALSCERRGDLREGPSPCALWYSPLCPCMSPRQMRQRHSQFAPDILLPQTLMENIATETSPFAVLCSIYWGCYN